MEYENPLDQAIHRFQHRWETDRQFRAMMSGVFGLLLIVCLCSGVGILDMGATRVLAAVGIGGSTTDQSGGSAQQNTDTGVQVNGNFEFPTASVPTWPAPAIPQASPIPASGTPAPTPTPSPTPTDVPTTGPCTSNCGGGGPSVTVTGFANPAAWTQGASVELHFHTSIPNDGVNAFIHWANGAQTLSAGGGGGIPPGPSGTDLAGNAIWPLTVPADSRCAGTVKVDYSANDHGTPVYGNAIYISCH